MEKILYTEQTEWEIRKLSNFTIIPSPVCEPSEENPRGHCLQLPNGMTAIPGNYIGKNDNGEFVVFHKLLFGLGEERFWEVVKQENGNTTYKKEDGNLVIAEHFMNLTN